MKRKPYHLTKSLRGRLMAGQEPLKLLMMVRFHPPQQLFFYGTINFMKNNKTTLYVLVVIVIIVVIGFSAYKFRTTTQAEPATYSGNSAEEVARNYVKANSSEDMEFILKKDFDNGTFVKFYVTPTGKYASSTDEARLFLKKTTTGYEVIGFGTAFPGLEEIYPELKGQI